MELGYVDKAAAIRVMGQFENYCIRLSWRATPERSRVAGEARASRTIPSMYPSLMPHQGILPRLFSSLSLRLQDNKVAEEKFLRELPAAAWAETHFRDASTYAYPGCAGTRAPLSTTSSRHFFEEIDFPELSKSN